jgi:hypothetical protein
MVTPGLSQRMGSEVSDKVDRIAPSLHHLGDGVRRDGVISPLATLEQEMIVDEFDCIQIVLKSGKDFLVHDEHVFLASFLLLDRNSITNLAGLNIADLEREKVLHSKPRVDPHDEKESITMIITQKLLDAFNVFQLNDRFDLHN